jgi:amino acid transporter
MAAGKVFTRESTGLVKRVSVLDSISLNLSNMSVGAALGLIGFTMLNFAGVSGVNLVFASILAFAFSIPQIVVYTIMTQKYPRTGGDYVWVSRNLGGFFGSSLSFMGYTLETLAYLALISYSAVSAIGSVGLFFYPTSSFALGLIPGLAGTSNYVNEFLLGGFIFLVLILINIFSPQGGYKLVSTLTIIAVATLIIGIFSLMIAGQSGVSSYVNSLGITGGSYSQIASSYTGSTFDFGASLSLLPFFAIFVFPWLNAAPAVASEIKGKNSLRWNVPLSAVIAVVLITSGFAAMYYAGGYQFVTAALSGSYLSNPFSANNNLVLSYSFNFWTMAMGASGNTAVEWILGIGWIIWNITVLAYGIIVFSRYLFAQSFDRFLPSSFSNISSKYGSPWVAHIVDLVITTGLLAAAALLYESLQTLFAAAIAAMIYFFFVGVTAVVYGLKRDKGTSRNSSVLTVAGVLMALVFAYIIYQFLTNATIWGTAFNAFGIPGYEFAYIYVAASFIIGAVIYAVSRSYHKSRGVNIDLAYKEIPPE